MFISNRFVFIHFPRTGGTYLTTKLKKFWSPLNNKIHLKDIAKSHTPLKFLHDNDRKKQVFTILRDPISWYYSFYLHQRNRKAELKKNKPNYFYLYASNNETLKFEKFLLRILQPCPSDLKDWLGQNFIDDVYNKRFIFSFNEMVNCKVGFYTVLVREIIFYLEKNSTINNKENLNKFVEDHNITIFNYDYFPQNIISFLIKIDKINEDKYMGIDQNVRINQSANNREYPKLSYDIKTLIQEKDSFFNFLKLNQLINDF